MMRRMRSGLVTASAATTPIEASSGRMKMRSFTPEKNSAPSTISTRIIAVPRSRPASTVEITRAPTGTTGMNTCRQSPSSVCLRNST